jgi:hypothetical protein
VPPPALAFLQTVPIWINASFHYGPHAFHELASLPASKLLALTNGGGACYHPSEHWLLANGNLPSKAGCIEIYSSDHFVDW